MNKAREKKESGFCKYCSREECNYPNSELCKPTKMNNKKTCNYCHDQLVEMKQEFDVLSMLTPIYSYVCENASCIVYGLLQVPLEDMPGEKDNDRT